jgi:hypothetical protein
MPTHMTPRTSVQNHLESTPVTTRNLRGIRSPSMSPPPPPSAVYSENMSNAANTTVALSKTSWCTVCQTTNEENRKLALENEQLKETVKELFKLLSKSMVVEPH